MSETGQQPKPELGCHTEYFKTVPGILKLVELGLGFLLIILSSVFWWSGAGWLVFVSIFCFIATLVHAFFHLLGITDRFRVNRGWNFYEFCAYCVYTLFYFISAIVESAFGWFNPVIVACAVFCWFILVAYGADTFLYFQAWRHDQTEAAHSGHASNIEGPASQAPAPAPPTTEVHMGAPPAYTTTTTYNMNPTAGTLSMGATVATEPEYSQPQKW